MSPTVCLNMIVKNEAHVIRRCLDSVRPFVDHWVIVDTGSTDGTQDIIRAHFAGIRGELYDRPWRNFGYNRTEAIELARGKADYILVMDADNIFHAPDGWQWPDLTADMYRLTHRSNGTEYDMSILVSDRLRWRYVGVLHEYLTCDSPHGIESLAGPWIDRRNEGARSRDPDTYRKDAAVLEKALADEPGNTRYTFYLAQSWRDAGEHEKSRAVYRQRATMGGWDEEVWCSLYEVARLSERLGAPIAEVRSAYLDAYQARPSRAEPLYQLARLHRERNELALAYLFARQAAAVPRPADALFLDDAVYRWRADDEAAVAAYWTGDRAECFALCWALLDGDRLPDSERARIEANLDHAAEAVAETSKRYPQEIVNRLADPGRPQPRASSVTLTVTTRKRLDLFERTINSFLNCCRDIDLIDRFVCIDDNSSSDDRARMQTLFPFFEFIFKAEDEKGHAQSMNRLLDTVATQYWLHLEDDWHFIVTTDYVTRALSILETEPTVAQVLFNRNYAETLADRLLVGGVLRRHPESGLRYLVHQHVPEGAVRDEFYRRFTPEALSNVARPHFAIRPSLLRTEAIRSLGRFNQGVGAFEQEFANRYTAAGLQSAFFDSVTCMHIGHPGGGRNSDRPSVCLPNELWNWK